MKIRYIIDDFLGYARQSKILRKIFAPLYHKIHNDNSVEVESEMKEQLHKNGLEVLKTFDRIMTQHGFKYSLAFGTMLGAVREKGFIKHDADIDVFMWIEDYTPLIKECLLQHGFTISHTFSVENGILGKEDTIEYEGVQIDIFYIYPPLEGRTYPYCCDFIVHRDCLSREHSVRKYGGLLPRRIEVPISHDVIRVPFETLTLPVLANAHEFLSFRYGSDYMTPNPNWVNGSNEYIIPWVGKVAEYCEYSSRTPNV